MKYPVAERFKSLQGEGLYTGTPMAFIRLVGCSVGQSVCTHCDTDFDRVYSHLGGGMYTPEQLVAWAEPYHIVNITGGEPLDRNLRPLVDAAHEAGMRVHVETSGTVMYDGARHGSINWITVSPKPKYLVDMIDLAAEVKVIYDGLGDGPGWPTLADADRWASANKLVYVQPRNLKNRIDGHNLDDLVAELTQSHPNLRLSAQLHKFIFVR
jgi:organic radical activating enzyme